MAGKKGINPFAKGKETMKEEKAEMKGMPKKGKSKGKKC